MTFPHPNLQNPVYIRSICLFAGNKASHPIIFNAVSSSWSETQQQFQGAELIWKNNLGSPVERDIAHLLIKCCRLVVNSEWIFESLVNCGIDLNSSNNYFPSPPIREIFHTLRELARLPKASQTPQTENQRFHLNKYAKFLLQTGKVKSEFQALSLAIRSRSPREIIKLFFEKAGATVDEIDSNYGETALLVATHAYLQGLVWEQEKQKHQPEFFEIIRYLIQMGSDPCVKSKIAGWSLSRSRIIPYREACSKRELDLVRIFFEEPRNLCSETKSKQELEDLIPSVNSYTWKNPQQSADETPWKTCVLNCDFELFKYLLVDVPKNVKNAEWKLERKEKDRLKQNNDKNSLDKLPQKYLAHFGSNPTGCGTTVVIFIVEKIVKILSNKSANRTAKKDDENIQKLCNMLKLIQQELPVNETGFDAKTRKGEVVLEVFIKQSFAAGFSKRLLEIFKFFIEELKININQKNDQKETPLTIARRECDDLQKARKLPSEVKELIEYMQKNGGRSH